jgi:nucleoside triphosphatase
MTRTYPEATVGALAVNSAGEVLIARPRRWNDKYTVPGGHIELGERAEDAIKCEVKEETGLEVEVVKLLLVQQAIYPKDYYRHEHFVFMDYVCRAKRMNVKLDGGELQSSTWITPEEGLKLDTEEYTKNFVIKYLQDLKRDRRS